MTLSTEEVVHPNYWNLAGMQKSKGKENGNAVWCFSTLIYQYLEEWSQFKDKWSALTVTTEQSQDIWRLLHISPMRVLFSSWVRTTQNRSKQKHFLQSKSYENSRKIFLEKFIDT